MHGRLIAWQYTAADLIPRAMFRWKRDGLLSKDMTCYMTRARLGPRKNKETDMTIGLYKASRKSHPR